MFTGWREMEMEITLTTKIPSSSQDAEATGYPKGRSTSLSYKCSITINIITSASLLQCKGISRCAWCKVFAQPRSTVFVQKAKPQVPGMVESQAFCSNELCSSRAETSLLGLNMGWKGWAKKTNSVFFLLHLKGTEFGMYKINNRDRKDL